MDNSAPSNAVLLEVIRTQADIARLGLDLGGIMALVTERAQILTHANGAAIELAEENEMVYRAATGMAASQLGLRLGRDGSLSGLCVRGGEILFCEDSEIDPRVDREACQRVGLRSMVLVPLKHGDMIVGVLKVMASTPSAFTEVDHRVLELMSDLVGAAMFHAGKYGTEELHLKATHDAMTGLPNRALFCDRLNQSLDLAKRQGAKIAVLTIDIDGLKRINETYGRRAGDAAITELASRLKAVVPRLDIVARIGGDEFAAILPNIGGKGAARAGILRVHEQIRLPFRFGEIPLKLEASIGLAIFAEDGTNATILVDCADRDLYAMKHARKENRVRYS